MATNIAAPARISATPVIASAEKRLPIRLASSRVPARRSAHQKHGSPPSQSAAPSSCAPVASSGKPLSRSRAAAWLSASAVQRKSAPAAPSALRVDAAGTDPIDASKPIMTAMMTLAAPAITKPAPATSRQDTVSEAARTAAFTTVVAVTATTTANAAAWMTRRHPTKTGLSSRCTSPASGVATSTTKATLPSKTDCATKSRPRRTTLRKPKMSNSVLNERGHRRLPKNSPRRA